MSFIIIMLCVALCSLIFFTQVAAQGELQVTLREARNLPVGGLPWQSNPYCRLLLGNQVVSSRRDDDTSHAGRHRAPVWNQEFHFLVEDASSQVRHCHYRTMTNCLL